MARITSEITISLIAAAWLALPFGAHQALAQPPEPPAQAAPAQPQTAPPAPPSVQAQPEVQPQAAPGQAGVETPPGCPAAPPANVKPCPPVPSESKEFGGPYWTEKRLEAKPFICPRYSYPEKAIRKFGRGVTNIVTAPIELFNQPLNYLYQTERTGFLSDTTALLVGVPVGVGWIFYRAFAGIFDIFTFPVPPFQPVIEPEFVSNDFQKRRVLELKSPAEVQQRLEEEQEAN